MNDFIVKDGLVANGSIKGNTGTVTGNATLDLSTGDAFEVTPTADVTFVFSNPPAAGNAQAFSVALNGVEIGAPYDLANASYDSVSFSVAAQETFPSDLFFKPDGTKMYVLGYLGDAVYEYDLSTTWDISTATYLQNFSVATQETFPYGVFFKPDGTKMYVIGASDAIYEYNLSTAWDVSTASYLQSFSVASQDGLPTGLSFKPDGLKVYVMGATSDAIHEYNLSTAWNISTATYFQNFSVLAQETNPQGIFFKPDGTKVFVIGQNGQDVTEYSLSTAWDVSTASFLQIFSVAAQESFPQGMFFRDSGTKMYIIGSTSDTIYQYSTGSVPAPATITYPASVAWSGGTAPASPADGETDLLTFYTEDGGNTYYGFKVGDALA